MNLICVHCFLLVVATFSPTSISPNLFSDLENVKMFTPSLQHIPLLEYLLCVRKPLVDLVVVSSDPWSPDFEYSTVADPGFPTNVDTIDTVEGVCNGFLPYTRFLGFPEFSGYHQWQQESQ